MFISEIKETDGIENNAQGVGFVLYDLRGKHARVGSAAVILQNLKFVFTTAVLDDFFTRAIGAMVHLFTNDGFAKLVATPEQIEEWARVWNSFGF